MTSQPCQEVKACLAAATTAVTTADVTTRGELVPVYMLAMHLPSADLVAEDYTETSGSVVRRVKEWQNYDVALSILHWRCA